MSRAASRTGCGRAPWSTKSWAENARLPKRRMVMATCGEAGGTQMATREPSSSRASRMGTTAGSRPSGRAIWMAARSRAALPRAGRIVPPDGPAAFDPHVLRAVNHDLAHVGIVQHRFQPGQKRFQVIHPSRMAHISPCSTARQYGLSLGRYHGLR